MPNYRRSFHPGGAFFLTLVTHGREPMLIDAVARRALKQSISLTRRERPFDLVAVALLPDHVHLLVQLPPGDSDFSTRVAAIKSRFSRACSARASDRSASEKRQGYAGVWQKRFWERVLRDEKQRDACCDYIHHNPVKHGLAKCPHDWPWSSFRRFVRDNRYSPDGHCRCDDRPAKSVMGIEDFAEYDV